MMDSHLANILVVAAHPDDELLGVGATIRRLVDQGAKARAVILAEGVTSRSDHRCDADPNELIELQKDAREAAKVIGYESVDLCGFPDNRMDQLDLLDVIKEVAGYVDRYRPTAIFTHHAGDLNIDHQISCRAVLTACRPVGNGSVKSIYAFETPSSTEWNYVQDVPFCPNAYFDVSDTLESKILGMSKYRSESAVAPHPRSAEALRALAGYRGSNVGCRYAEAFMLLRSIL